MDLTGAVLAHRQKQLVLRDRLRDTALDAWRVVEPADPMGSWLTKVPALTNLTKQALTLSASGSTQYVSASLAAQNVTPDPAYTVVPRAFAETAFDGRPLETLIAAPAAKVRGLIAQGMPDGDALASGARELAMILGTELADAGRSGVSSAMLADRRTTGYYREPGPSACSRCAILAGKWYSTYEGAAFERHPYCQCTAIPAANRGSGNPVARSPESYFESLSKVRQDAVFGKDAAEAIREGADISQVVNASRGMSSGGWTTTSGTTRRGYYGGATDAGRSGAARLTPSAIFRLSASRDEAVSMLVKYGYLI